MTWEEIREHHPDQWVVLVEQELHADDRSLLAARVLTTGASRLEAMQRAYPAVKVFASYGCRHTGVRHRPPRGAETVAAQAEPRPAPVAPVRTDERLTWKQICERYPAQWVVLAGDDRQPYDATELETARVIAVGSTRAEVKERARPLLDSCDDEWSCHYTGPIRRRA